MTSLDTTYMGLSLKNPFVVAACSISSRVERIQMAERAGAGALVIRSLFEEQIQFDALRMQDALAVGSESFAESLSHFPQLEHGGAEEHLMWVEKARQAVQMPLIASLNAVSSGGWTTYARKLESTGVDGLELNVYAVPATPAKTGHEIEQQLYKIVEEVQKQVSIPVAVKLSPFYTSVAEIAAALDHRNIQALVLFNRFLQPDIDPQTENLRNEMAYSRPQDMRLPLRWVTLLSGRIKADLALNTGVHSGVDAAKAILAGATVVQTASALLEQGIPYLSTMIRELEQWMREKGYVRLDDFRGKLSQKQADDPFVYERAQYVRLLMSQK